MSTRPTATWMLASPLHAIAVGFGSGLSPWAPGTVGTLWAWLTYGVLAPRLGDVGWALLLAAGLGMGWWACTAAARSLRSGDPGAIVWDEILAFWLVLWFIGPLGWRWQLAAFVLFRLFDTLKPGPVGWADRAFKTPPGQTPGWRAGLGILVDDLVAAGLTLLVLALWRF